MPIHNRFADLHPEITEWRRHLHTIPELGFDLPKTAAYVEERLREIGVDKLETGVAQTGMVAVIKGKTDTSGRVIALRADMDALPIHETANVDYKSTHDGKMLVAMTVTLPCCLALRNIWRRRVILMARLCCFSNLRKRAGAAAKSWSMTA
jgi:hypothetical protein